MARCFFQGLGCNFVTETEVLIHFIVFEKLGKLVSLVMWFYSITKQHSLFVFKGEEGKKGMNMLLYRKQGKKDCFTFLLSEIIYFHSIASLFVIPWLCGYTQAGFVSVSKTLIMLPLKLGIRQQKGQQCHLPHGLYDFISEIELWEPIFQATLK